MANSLILNIPYSSSLIPEKDERTFLPHLEFTSIAEALKNREKTGEMRVERSIAIEKELFTMTAWYTDELFDHSIGKAIISPVSRLVCDTERNYPDYLEPLAKRGMGFCYERNADDKLIKEFDDEYKTEVLFKYYGTHRVALNKAIEETLNKNYKALLLNCHSFVDEEYAPDIYLYTSAEHTPEHLEKVGHKVFSANGYKVCTKNGARVPVAFKDEELLEVITISVNRKLYLKPGTNEKSEGFEKLKSTLMELEQILD